MHRLLLVALATSLLWSCGGTVAQAQVAPGSPTAAIGVITFGFDVNASTLRVDRPMGVFAVTNAAIGWSAWLNEPAGGETVNVMYVSEGADGYETFIHQELLVVASPLLTILANTSDIGAIVGAKPGLYTMRILQHARILAQGTFRLTAAP